MLVVEQKQGRIEALPLSVLTWLRMGRFVRQSNQISNEFLTQFDITLAQFEVLTHIDAYAPITQTELADRLTVTCGGLSRMLTRLENEGLIQRTRDWKTKHISLTDAGEEKLAAVYPKQVAFQSAMFEDVLSATEIKQLHALVRTVHKHSENLSSESTDHE